MNESKEDRPTAIVVWNYPDNHSRNDNWGDYFVFFVCLVDIPFNKKGLVVYNKQRHSH